MEHGSGEEEVLLDSPLELLQEGVLAVLQLHKPVAVDEKVEGSTVRHGGIFDRHLPQGGTELARPRQVQTQEGPNPLVGCLGRLPDVDGGETEAGGSYHFQHTVVARLPQDQLVQMGEPCQGLPGECLLLGRDGWAVKELEGKTRGSVGAQVLQGVKDSHPVLHPDKSWHLQAGCVGGVACREEGDEHVRAVRGIDF